MSDLDILDIDANIRTNFEKELERLQEYKSKLEMLSLTLEKQNIKVNTRLSLEKAYKNMQDRVHNIENMTDYNFYMNESSILLEKYRQILKKPQKVNFMGKSTRNNKEKTEIINKYMELAKKYIDYDFEIKKKRGLSCDNCKNRKNLIYIDNSLTICGKCSARITVMKHTSNYNDIERVNISNKYKYDPKVHFRDGVEQYQGKQNCTIPKKVYEDLEEQFERHHLLQGDKDTPKEIRFQNVTKLHIAIFLKTLGYSKQYENINLIHYHFTGIKPNDISHLEGQLLDDFDTLIDLYYKRFNNIKRKSFINTQYVLYQLLKRHKYSCKEEEFGILKTTDRKTFHDDVCKQLFEELGWNHTPFF